MTPQEDYKEYEKIAEHAKEKAKDIMKNWEEEQLTIREVERIIELLKDGTTAAYHKWRRETPFRKDIN